MLERGRGGYLGREVDGGGWEGLEFRAVYCTLEGEEVLVVGKKER